MTLLLPALVAQADGVRNAGSEAGGGFRAAEITTPPPGTPTTPTPPPTTCPPGVVCPPAAPPAGKPPATVLPPTGGADHQDLVMMGGALMVGVIIVHRYKNKQERKVG